MVIKTINGDKLAAMIAQGATQLAANAEYVDSLNVFPVPDGDTGSNMSMTLTAGAEEVLKHESATVAIVGKHFSKGLLMGARGNSGVILSQLFRGFSKTIEDKEEINASGLAQAFDNGVKTAYKAVMKPVEGTILTVARESAEAGIKAVNNGVEDVVELMAIITEAGERSLAGTPDLLPVLKEVGVVDSGGQGLQIVYQAFLAELKGEAQATPLQPTSLSNLVTIEHENAVTDYMNPEDIKFGYCTEIMVQINNPGEKAFNEDQFRNTLADYGDSLIVIADDEIAKVHVHSNTPGQVIDYGQSFGPLLKIKVDNMREQNSDLQGKKAPAATPKKDVAVIAVSSGAGLDEIFKSLNVDIIVSGGQTMNPSTADLLRAVEQVNAKHVIILPNNKNIIMAADQAVEMSETTQIAVVKSKTIQQGLAACFAYMPDETFENNQAEMNEALESVCSGSITTAVRDTEIKGVKIVKDEFIGIVEGTIVLSEKARDEAAFNTLVQMIDEDTEIVTIITGEEATIEGAEAIAERIENKFEDVEIEIKEGNQAVYPYLFSVE